jgi:N-acetylglutamate synthase
MSTNNLDFTEHELRRVEEISQNASRPERGVMIDGWSVGLSPSKARRSRCVNAFYPSMRSFEENLSATRALYREAGLPCVFRVTRFVGDATLDEKLVAIGGERVGSTLVQLLRLMPNFVGRMKNLSGSIDLIVKVESGPDIVRQCLMELRGDTAEQFAALRTRWKTLPLPIRSYVAQDANGVPLSHVLTIAEDRCVGVFDVVTHASQRGRGLASALIARALADAHAHGATTAYLQVEATNPAVRVYEKLGFRTAYDYWYREVPDTL